MEREELRFRLQSLYNEADLLLRNQKIDASDLKRQERDFADLKVFERIPFEDDLPGLERQLRASAAEHGVRLDRFVPDGESGMGPPPPVRVYTDSRQLRLSENQLAQTLWFRVVLRGQEARVKGWIRGLRGEQLRLVEPEGDAVAPPLRHLADGRWQLRAKAFRFRTLRFPELVARNPFALLPAWASRSPADFARQEPRLWEYVREIRQLEPQAAPLLQKRARFLLNSQRMSFFISKATGRP